MTRKGGPEWAAFFVLRSPGEAQRNPGLHIYWSRISLRFIRATELQLAPSAPLSHRRGKLFGAVALGHVDHCYHRRGEFVDIADVGEVALGGAAHRLRRDAVEQDEAEITVFPPRCRAGVELLPAKMKNLVRLLAGDFPVGDNVRVLADQRQALVGMRSQLEEQQR